jgi:hypothetical protein
VGPMPMLDLACREAFRCLSRSTVVELAGKSGVVFDETKHIDLFSTLQDVIKSHLKLTDDAVLYIILKRLSDTALTKMERTRALAEIDAAVECLERDDEKVVMSEKESAENGEREMKTLEDKCCKMRKAIKADVIAMAKGRGRGGGGRGRGRGRGAAGAPGGHDPAMPTHVDQANAALLCPPQSHIWRGLNRGEWRGHCPPFQRISEPWSRAGERHAMMEILRRLWHRHCIKDGLTWPEDVPQILFDL